MRPDMLSRRKGVQVDTGIRMHNCGCAEPGLGISYVAMYDSYVVMYTALTLDHGREQPSSTCVVSIWGTWGQWCSRKFISDGVVSAGVRACSNQHREPTRGTCCIIIMPVVACCAALDRAPTWTSCGASQWGRKTALSPGHEVSFAKQREPRPTLGFQDISQRSTSATAVFLFGDLSVVLTLTCLVADPCRRGRLLWKVNRPLH
jgi:hypothetical protein